jgi:hypothetical protein
MITYFYRKINNLQVTLAICYLLGIFPQFNLQQVELNSGSIPHQKIDEKRGSDTLTLGTASSVFDSNKERLGLAFFYVVQVRISIFPVHSALKQTYLRPSLSRSGVFVF